MTPYTCSIYQGPASSLDSLRDYCSRSIRFHPFFYSILPLTHLPTSFYVHPISSRRRFFLKIQCKFSQKFHDFVKRVSRAIHFKSLLRVNFQETRSIALLILYAFIYIYIYAFVKTNISLVFPRNPLPSSRRITSHAVPNGG